MPKNKPIQRNVSIVPAIYIQVAGGLKPALTKNSSVAGTVIFPTICGMKNTAQIIRRRLNSLSRLNLSASDMAPSPHWVFNFRLKLLSLQPSIALGVKRIERRPVETRQFILNLVSDLAL